MDGTSIWLLLTIAVTNLVTAVLVLIAKRDIGRVEIATNSMKDALVAATARASRAEGRAEQRAETNALGHAGSQLLRKD